MTPRPTKRSTSLPTRRPPPPRRIWRIPFGLKFSGYARYGAHFQTGDQKYVGVDGSYNGASAIGRLGNESNGGEFQISKAFKSAQGAIWDLNVMFDHWSDEVNLKKAYVGVTNVLESNPNAYIWAGRDFHQRPQQGINDYFWMNHDGQGAGVKNFDIGGVQFDVAAVSQVKSCSPEVMADETNPSRITCTGSSDTGDNGHYALTTKTHNIKAGPIDVEVYANYGFDSKAVDSDARLECLIRPTFLPAGSPCRPGKRSAAGQDTSSSIPAVVPDGGINALSGLRF